MSGRFASGVGDAVRSERVDEILGIRGQDAKAAVRRGDLDKGAILDRLLKTLAATGFAVTAAAHMGAPMMLRPDAGAFVSNALNGALGTHVGVAGAERLAPFLAPWDMGVDQLGISCQTALAASSCKITVYKADTLGRPADLVTETATINTALTGTLFSAKSLTLKAGKLYWLGVRYSGTQTIRAILDTSSNAIAWSNAATPVAHLCLTRTLAYATPATDWTFANSQLSTTTAPLVLMRLA